MVHRIVVEDQSLRWYGRPPKIADDSIEFVRFQFHLPEDWDPLVLVAQFTQADTYNMLLSEDTCFLPKELTAGLCKLSLFGYAEGKPLRATSIPLVFQIEESGFVSSAETPIPPTPDLYAQLIEYFSSIAGSGGGGSGSGTINPEDIAAAVEDYLSKNPPEVPDLSEEVTRAEKAASDAEAAATRAEEAAKVTTDLDTTLTQPGKAADAKAVGDAIEELSGRTVDLTGYATEQFVRDGYQPKGNYLTEIPEGYAKTSDIPKKPEDIGAQPSGNYALKSEIPSVPVQSVNGKTGAVQLSAADVKARPENWMPSAQEVGALPNTYTPPNQTAEQVGADPKGTAATAVSQHNTADDSHGDIRLELKAINDRLTAFFDSDNQTLDELSEIVAYITSNKALIDSITTSKVSVADIINNLTTNVTNKPLSATQGVVLKGLIDAVSNSLANYQPKGDYALRSELPTVPTKVSAFTNDAGYLTIATLPLYNGEVE